MFTKSLTSFDFIEATESWVPKISFFFPENEGYLGTVLIKRIGLDENAKSSIESDFYFGILMGKKREDKETTICYKIFTSKDGKKPLILPERESRFLHR